MRKYIAVALIAVMWTVLNVGVFSSRMAEESFGANEQTMIFLVSNFLVGLLLGVLLFAVISRLMVSRKLKSISYGMVSSIAIVLYAALNLLSGIISVVRSLPGRFIWEIEKNTIKYNIKREYFTILIPVIFASLLVVFAAFPEIFGIFPEEARPPEPTNESVVTIVTEPKDTGYKNLDQIIVIALLVAITPYSMDVYITEKRRKRYEEEFAGFLYEFSELLRGGLDPVSAIKEIASPTVETERSLRALSPHLKKAAALLDWGRPFETVITRLALSLNSPLISKYSYLIVQASSMGGANATTILKSSQDLEKTLQIEREKEGMLREYLFIIFAAQFILIAILYLLNTTLLPSIITMLKSGVGSAFGISAAATNINFKQGFFHVIMINAFASGIIAGQLTEGKARHGLKHSVILMTISYAASLIFLLR